MSSPILGTLKRTLWQKWRLVQRLGVVLVSVAAVMFGVVTLAGAAAPTEGSSVPNSAIPVGTFTAGTPFSSGQSINIVIPANSVFTNTTNLLILECTAPGGVIPTKTSACDGNTINGPSFTSNADGSVDFQAATSSLYQVYALPDSISLGETSTGGSPVCSATVECMLFIGYDQSDFTKPHFWSQPFNVVSNSDDKGENPGDGSASSTPTTAVGTQSTVTVSPATATADGHDSSVVTVTMRGNAGSNSGLPVPSKTVTLSQGAGHSIITPAHSPNVTDGNGQATFTVSDATTESVTYTATDTTDGVTASSPSNQPTVNFQAPVVGQAHSTVSATPTTVPSGSTTITVTLRDQAASPQPIAGKSVTLSGSGSTVVITPAATPNVTDASGVATFTATDTATETVTFTATDTTDGTTLTNTAAVTFGTLQVSPSKSTVVASTPAEAASTQGSAVTVTLLSSASDPVAGKAVALSTGSSTTSIAGPTPAMTGSNGQVTFTVTDSVVETVTVTATDATDGVTLATKPTVAFQAAAPSASQSTVTSQSPTSPADGQTQTLITVTMQDQFGHALSGKTIAMAANSGSGALVHPIAIGGSNNPGITDSSGQAQFEASDTTAEVVTFTATDKTDNMLTLTEMPSITYLAGPADPTGKFTTVVSSVNPPADGTSPSTITVTLADLFGNPVAGKTITLAALNGTSTIAPAQSPDVTDSKGHAIFSVTDAKAEVVTYQATDVTDSNTVLEREAVVTFGTPPAPPPVPEFSNVLASPSSVPADGTTTATISVFLNDGSGDAVGGKTVTLTAGSGKSTVTAVNATSDTTGLATFTVTDTTPESVTYTADDTTDSVTLSDLPVTVTFTASGNSTTTTTTTTPTSGSTTSTTTTTAGAGSTATTTSTTSTTVAAASSSGSSNSGSNGSISSGASTTGSTSSSLAFTGISTLVIWLFGVGVLLAGAGTLGRRRVKTVTS
jgi:hypothetical protein